MPVNGTELRSNGSLKEFKRWPLFEPNLLGL